MKVLLIAALLVSSALANATKIFSTDQYTDSQGRVISETTRGFTENGFQSPSSVCFRGDIKNVCQLIDQTQAAALEAYSSGEHGYFEVSSCNVTGATVQLVYDQITDWGDKTDLTLTITKCHW